MRLAFVLPFLLLTACARTPIAVRPAPAVETLRLDYRIRYTPSPHAITVDVALDGPARDFQFTQPGGVSTVQVESDGRAREVRVQRDGTVPLPPGATRLRYVYPLEALERGHGGSFFSGVGRPGSLVIAGRAYLVRPKRAAEVIAQARFEGAEVLLPWTPRADRTYELSGDELVDSGFHSWGGRRCFEEVDGATLAIAVHEGPMPADDAFLCGWIRDSAREVLTVRERFPFRRVVVHLVASGGDEPSPFGMLSWSTPPSLALFVGSDAPKSAFAHDWVAVHEFLHLLHPAFRHQAPWLSEGLATYYTEIVRMRSGRQSEEEGWRELALGLARGRAQADGADLQGTVEALKRGVYLPVYWAGALIALELDVAIRKATSGRGSLDDALALLASRGPVATVDAFGRAVDEVAGRPVFDEVITPAREGPALERADDVLARLGVNVRDGKVQLDDAPDSALRKVISNAD